MAIVTSATKPHCRFCSFGPAMPDNAQTKKKSRPPSAEASFVPIPNPAPIYANHEAPPVPPYLPMNAPTMYNPSLSGPQVASGFSDPRISGKQFPTISEPSWYMSEPNFSYPREPMGHSKSVSISLYFDAVRLSEELKPQSEVANFQPPLPQAHGPEISSPFPSGMHISSGPSMLENQTVPESHGIGSLADANRSLNSLNSNQFYAVPTYGPPFPELVLSPPEQQYPLKLEQFSPKMDFTSKPEHPLKQEYQTRPNLQVAAEYSPKSYVNGPGGNDMFFHENQNLFAAPLFSPIQPDLQRQISHQLLQQLGPQGPPDVQKETEANVSQYGEPKLNVLNATWAKLLWSITSVDVLNVNSYLLSFLREEGEDIPLDEFYNILYNFENVHQYMETEIDSKIDKVSPTDTFDNSARLFHSVLGAFQNPDQLRLYFPSADLSMSKVSSVNFYDLLRSFLALKILASTLVEVEETKYLGGVPIIPRHTIYKVYYILCQKLILRYPGLHGSDAQKSIILGQSKLGKLLKLSFPKLKSKRLGRRGESKYNYLGVVWNKQVVDRSILELCDLEQPQLNQTLRNLEALRAGQRRRFLVNPSVSQNNPESEHGSGAVSGSGPGSRSVPGSRNMPPQFSKKNIIDPRTSAGESRSGTPTGTPSSTSLPSFVLPDTTFPLDLAPRLGWMHTSLRRSLAILHPLGVERSDFDALLDVSKMKNCDDWLFSRFCHSLDKLLEAHPHRLRHLLLAVALLVMPHMVGGPEPALKTNVTHLALHLRAKYAHTAVAPVLEAYTSMMRRMAHLYDLLHQLVRERLTLFAPAVAADISALLALDSTHPFAPDPMDSSSMHRWSDSGMNRWSNLRRMLCDSMVYTACGRGSVFRLEDVVDRVDHAAQHLEQAVGRMTQEMVEDVLGRPPAQYAQWLIHAVHLCLFVAEVVEYPVQIVTGCSLFATHQLLLFVGAEHRRRGVREEVMRHWWYLTSFLNEYVAVVGEVVGLHQCVG